MADSLADRLADLEALSTAELRARWEQVFNRTAPIRASRDLLLRALAYHIQERSEGGLSKSTRRRLAKLAGLNGENRAPISPPILQLKLATGGHARVLALAKKYDAEILDDAQNSCTVQLTGGVAEIDAFVEEASQIGKIAAVARSGSVTVSKGEVTLSSYVRHHRLTG